MSRYHGKSGSLSLDGETILGLRNISSNMEREMEEVTPMKATELGTVKSWIPKNAGYKIVAEAFLDSDNQDEVELWFTDTPIENEQLAFTITHGPKSFMGLCHISKLEFKQVVDGMLTWDIELTVDGAIV